MFFSIIIPVYNVAPYLRECLDSVMAQTFADWEAICVDDGSTDGSGAILDEYAVRDKRFRVIHQSNAGVSAARNKALDEAHGEWLCFLDADDKVECHWLEDIANGIDRFPNADWIRMSYRDWYEGMEPEPWPDDSKHKCAYGLFTDVPNMVWNHMAYAGMPFLNVYNREVVGDLRFDTSIWFGEDACFSADYMHRSKRVATIPNDSYRYRIRNDSATRVLKTFHDTSIALGNILRRWETIPGDTGAFTPSILRHARRCRRIMTRNENKMWLRFLREAYRERFFSFGRIAGLKTKLRWLLYMMTGRPRFMVEPFGPKWLLPDKWAEEEKR